MASSKDFVDFVCDQIREAGEIANRKMFGEYAVYCDGKVVALICDDQLFVKKTSAAGAVLGGDAEEGLPYPGAKPYYLISDIDNGSFLTRLVKAVCDELPAPKPKKGKARRK